MKTHDHSRRSFLSTTGIVSATVAVGVPCTLVAKTSGQKSEKTYDAIVCGGGTSGLPSAVAAARRGARVALIERYGFLGGNAAFSIMPAWHGLREHHSGMLTEFARRVEASGVGPIPLEDAHIEPEVLKMLFLQMALDSGIDLYLHHLLTGCVKEGTRVRQLITESKSGRRVFAANVFVDASGDGDLCYHAGAKYELGSKGQTQAMTLRFRVGYVDLPRFTAWAEAHPEYRFAKSFQRLAKRDEKRPARPGIMFGSRLDLMFAGFKDKYPDLPTDTYFNCSCIRPNELSINSTRVYDLNPTKADDLTKAEVVTRRQAWAIWRFLKENIPGFEDSVIVETAAQVGIRESRRVVGDYVLTAEDGIAHKEFEDSVQTCRVDWDSHDKGNYQRESIGGLVDVPYRVFLPAGLEGVLTAGRCSSSDHLMNSGFRRMENAFQTGEVAGTAAGICAKSSLTPRRISVRELQQELKKNGLKTNQREFR